MTDLHHFKKSVSEGKLPSDLAPHLLALWHDGRGDWKSAHDQIDHLEDRPSAHIHAYLHRKEGDIWNADYWYRKSGFPRPNITLKQEWEQLLLKYFPPGIR